MDNDNMGDKINFEDSHHKAILVVDIIIRTNTMMFIVTVIEIRETSPFAVLA